MVRVSTQITTASTAARRAVKPSRWSDRCSTDSATCRLMGSTTRSRSVRVAVRPAWLAFCAGAEGPVERRRPTESPAFPGRDAGERRFGSGLAVNLFRLQRVSGERQVAGVACRVAEGLLDPQQLIV